MLEKDQLFIQTEIEAALGKITINEKYILNRLERLESQITQNKSIKTQYIEKVGFFIDFFIEQTNQIDNSTYKIWIQSWMQQFSGKGYPKFTSNSEGYKLEFFNQTTGQFYAEVVYNQKKNLILSSMMSTDLSNHAHILSNYNTFLGVILDSILGKKPTSIDTIQGVVGITGLNFNPSANTQAEKEFLLFREKVSYPVQKSLFLPLETFIKKTS